MEWDLDYWNTGEWQVVEERLNDLRGANKIGCPRRQDMFRALRTTAPGDVRVCILGQDPYPSPAHATGIAFSVPEYIKELPPTLKNILQEYSDDLHYPLPTSGDLSAWCSRGVLLWNCIPSCESGKSLSHSSWSEWDPLTNEIIHKLDNTNKVVFAALGSVAQEFATYIINSVLLSVSHPSPRGN